MIDKNGNLRCDNCHKKLGAELVGRIAIVCPKCKMYNKFDTNKLPMEWIDESDVLHNPEKSSP